ncbi:MAG: Ig-like domain repeat protein [Chloroflexi bacterium]|nr:Ig-like domain repeat protein [Chloroflexota bacterium]
MIKRLAITTTVLVLVLAGLGSGIVAADDLSPSLAPELRLDRATKTGAKGQLALSAVMTTSAGKPVSDAPVAFFQEVEFFGARAAHLGTAVTDATGTAIISYQPAQRGRQVIRARFDGDPRYAKAEATATIEVRDAVTQLESEPLPLAQVREWLPWGLSAVMVAVYAGLFGVLVGTVVGVRRIAGSEGHRNGKGTFVDER